MRISVIIPTRDRIDLLKRCLDAVLRQSLPEGEFEVIVVNDSATPLPPLPMGGAISYSQTKGAQGPAAARNLGASMARGAVLAFTDDDTIPDKDWLRGGLELFQSDNVIAVSGRVIVPLERRPTDYELNESRLTESEFVTANCFVLKKVFNALNGFDERFQAAWREDSDLHFRLMDYATDRRLRVAKATKAVVLHPVRPGFWGVSLFQQSKAQYNALLYKKHPAHYRQRIQSNPPWKSYLAGSAFVFTIVCVTMREWSWAILGSGLWVLMAVTFALRRLEHTSRDLRHITEMVITSAFVPVLSVYWRLRGALRFRVPFL